MRKTILAMLAAVSLSTPALADSKKRRRVTILWMLGCMLLQECTDGCSRT